MHESGRWQRSPDDPAIDAALLMPAIRGGLPPEDNPRAGCRLCAPTCAQLTQDGYAYRFRHAPGPLGDAEGAFLLCGFIVALALHQQGDEAGAARWFERTRAACGSPRPVLGGIRRDRTGGHGATCRRRLRARAHAPGVRGAGWPPPGSRQ